MKKITNIALVAAFALSLPFVSFAATYAYVDQSGEVKTVVADTPWIALTVAPNIDEHSGVILLDSSADNELIGDRVQSV